MNSLVNSGHEYATLGATDYYTLHNPPILIWLDGTVITSIWFPQITKERSLDS